MEPGSVKLKFVVHVMNEDGVWLRRWGVEILEATVKREHIGGVRFLEVDLLMIAQVFIF